MDRLGCRRLPFFSLGSFDASSTATARCAKIRPQPELLAAVHGACRGRASCRLRPRGDKPVLYRIEHQSTDDGADPRRLRDRRPSCGGREPSRRLSPRPDLSKRRRSRRPRPPRTKPPGGSAPPRSARKPWRRHKAEFRPPSRQESKPVRRRGAVAGCQRAARPRSPRRSPRQPAAARPDRGAGSRIHTSIARSQAGAEPSPEQQDSVQCGGTSVSVEFGLPKIMHQRPAQQAADDGGDRAGKWRRSAPTSA